MPSRFDQRPQAAESPQLRPSRGELLVRLPEPLQNAHEHNDLLHKIMLLAAWVQLGGVVLGPPIGLFVMVMIWRWWRRRRNAIYD